jgi:hypothetical protein
MIDKVYHVCLRFDKCPVPSIHDGVGVRCTARSEDYTRVGYAGGVTGPSWELVLCNKP